MSLEIKRLIDRQIHTITLTEEELEQAYRIKERHYLEEDFANVLADTTQNPDTRFHSGHLEEFPELTDWLCECFDHFYDANISWIRSDTRSHCCPLTRPNRSVSCSPF